MSFACKRYSFSGVTPTGSRPTPKGYACSLRRYRYINNFIRDVSHALNTLPPEAARLAEFVAKYVADELDAGTPEGRVDVETIYAAIVVYTVVIGQKRAA